MYYNKNLFVNEQIREQVKRLEKKQVIFVISIAVTALVLYIGALILLVMFLGDEFPCGYVIPALSATLLAILFAVLVPVSKRINKLRLLQTEQLKNTVYGEKYLSLLQTGKKCEKLSYCLIIPAVAVGLIASLVLAILFPYDFYYSYIGFLAPVLIMIIAALIVLNHSRKEIRNKEYELIDFINKQYELEVARATAEAKKKAEAEAAANAATQPQQQTQN